MYFRVCSIDMQVSIGKKCLQHRGNFLATTPQNCTKVACGKGGRFQKGKRVPREEEVL